MIRNSACRGPAAGTVPRESFDGEYVRRLTHGDPEIERHFAAYFGPLLWVKLRSRLRSSELAHDARQETFVRVLAVLRLKGGIEHPERLGAFVNAVCNNVLYETYRAYARVDLAADQLVDEAGKTEDPEAALISEDCKEQVRQVLASLPARDQEILRLIFFEDIDRAQICLKLRIEEGYLRVLLHRAKARFRAKMTERFPGPPGFTAAIPWAASA